MLLFSLCSISSSTWMGMWGMMEIVMFIFFPLLLNMGKEKQASLNSLWKYFVVQTFSSITIIVILLGESFGSLSESDAVLIAIFGVMVKIGMVPFHGWSFHMVEGLTKTQFFLLNSVMKIPPLGFVASLSPYMESSLAFVYVISGVVSAVSLLSSLSVKWCLLASSTYSMSWVMCSSLLGKGEMSAFFLLYVGSLFLVILNFPGWSKGIWGAGSCSLILSLSVFNLMGSPPSGVFWGKVAVLSSLLEVGSYELSILLLLLSALANLFYVKLVIFNLMKVFNPLIANFYVMVMGSITLLMSFLGLGVFAL